VGDDNTGLAGIEYTYDEYLKGTNGRAVKATDAAGNPLPFKYESFIEAQDGLNIVTTIDYTIQSILEKYILEAYRDNNPNEKVTGIVMDVNTGEILASALYPNYDLNEYNSLSDYYQLKLDSFEGNEEERSQYRSQLMYEMWDNSMVSKTYEPGSTFKIITSCMALEEDVIKPSDQFTCKTINIAGHNIHCHSHTGHGVQDFATALKNSCNPAFVQIGTKVGTKLFEQYFEAFGYAEPSKTDILGEAASIYYKTTNTQFEALELAVYSFGQTFKVTPLQHLRAVSAIANGGYLVTPHIAKALLDNQGNTVKTFEFEKARQVVSQETCDIVLNALINSTKNANVNGYNVVSKTGTSQKRDKEDGYYVSSCVTFAPAEDPQIAILVLVDEPTGSQYYGSLVAAPVISKVLTEVLPYMGIEPTHAETNNITLSSYIGSEVSSARIVLEEMGVKCIVKGDGSVVTDQIPSAGSVITENGVIVLYTDGEAIEETVKVPNVINFTPSAANKAVINNNLNISIKGIFENDYTNCMVVSQTPAAGEYVAPGTVIEVLFRYETEG
jgi:stage V sporulation protein D (sporulation-specific penicillin-binding protein)